MATRKAPHADTVTKRPANQPSGPMVRFGKGTMDDEAEVEAFIDASGNRPRRDELYDRINFLRTGRRTPRKPASY